MSGKKQARSAANALLLLDYMKQFQREYKRTPTLRECADNFSTSTSVISYWLREQLVPMGHVRLTEKIARGIEIVDERRHLAAYVCPMPECTFFTSSKSMHCPDHPTQTLLATTLVELENE
jgi:hypothetical protein